MERLKHWHFIFGALGFSEFFQEHDLNETLLLPLQTSDEHDLDLLEYKPPFRIVTHYEDTSQMSSFLQHLGMYTHQSIKLAPPGLDVSFP